jgi:hypothetical protein
VTPAIRYGPEVFGRVVLVGSALVEPILVSVDQPNLTLIAHPPLGVDGLRGSVTARSASSVRSGQVWSSTVAPPAFLRTDSMPLAALALDS